MSLDTRTGTLEEAVRETARDVTGVWTDLSRLRTDFDEFCGEMTEFRTETSERLGRIEEVLAAIRSKLDA